MIFGDYTDRISDNLWKLHWKTIWWSSEITLTEFLMIFGGCTTKISDALWRLHRENFWWSLENTLQKNLMFLRSAQKRRVLRKNDDSWRLQCENFCRSLGIVLKKKKSADLWRLHWTKNADYWRRYWEKMMIIGNCIGQLSDVFQVALVNFG